MAQSLTRSLPMATARALLDPADRRLVEALRERQHHVAPQRRRSGGDLDRSDCGFGVCWGLGIGHGGGWRREMTGEKRAPVAAARKRSTRRRRSARLSRRGRAAPEDDASVLENEEFRWRYALDLHTEQLSKLNSPSVKTMDILRLSGRVNSMMNL